MLITHPTALHTNATPASSNSRSHNFGASFHVIGDAHNLQNFTTFEGHDHVYIGNGKGSHTNSSSSSNFPSLTQPYVSSSP